MDLLYIKLSDFLTVRFIDCDNILDKTSPLFMKLFSKRRLQYTSKIEDIDRDQFITIILKKKDRLNQHINIKNLLSIYVSFNYFELFDNINNYYTKISVDHDILQFIINYFTIPVTISKKNDNFFVPSGKYKSIDIRVGFNNTYILTQNNDLNTEIKFKNKIFKIKSKVISKSKIISKQPYKNFSSSYCIEYLSSTLKLDLKYFMDGWFYQKYFTFLKDTFKIKYSDTKGPLADILQKIICCALQKRSDNLDYNKFQLFITHSHIYNNFITDLYNFKSVCKKKNILTKKLLSTYNNLYVPTSSLEFYTSKISYSNWFENFEIGEIFGCLLNGNFKRNCLQGYEPDIYVKNVNQCVLSSDDYIDSHKYYFDKNQYFDDGRKSSSLISFDGIGSGNIFLPIYICKPHFRLINNHIKYITSINIYQSPIKFRKKNILIYVSIITELIYNTFCNNNFNTEKWCNILINYILFVKELIKIYYSNSELVTLFNMYLNKVKFNTNFVIGLYIILKLNKVETTLIGINELILKILEEEIRIQSSKIVTSLEKHILNILDINLEKYYNFLEDLDPNYILNKDIIKIWQSETNKKNLLIFIKKLWSFNYFIKYISNDFDDFSNTIEETYGLLNNIQITNIRKIILTNKFPEDNDIIQGILNPLFEGHLIYNKLIIINLNNIVCKLIPSLTFDKCNNILKAMILQGLLQRNHNKRKIAIKNSDLYCNPILYTDACIIHCLKVYIKIWSIKNFNIISFNLKKKFKTTINIKTIAGIYYILNNNNDINTFLLECIKDGDIKNLRIKLNILSNDRFIKKKYEWLLPKKKIILTLTSETF